MYEQTVSRIIWVILTNVRANTDVNWTVGLSDQHINQVGVIDIANNKTQHKQSCVCYICIFWQFLIALQFNTYMYVVCKRRIIMDLYYWFVLIGKRSIVITYFEITR